MNRTGMKRIVRLACTILAAAFVFLSGGPAAQAQTTREVYWVKIYPGADKTLCVGQTTTLSVAYKLNPGQAEKGPPSFTFQVDHGNVSSANPAPGPAGAGFVFFNFTATQAGQAALFAQANQGDGSDIATITVKPDCEYSYDLLVMLDVTSSNAGVVLKWAQVIRTAGVFTPADAELAPLAPLSPNAQLDTTVTIYDEQVADQDECNVPATTWTGLEGTGSAIVSGQLLNGGTREGVRVIIDSVSIKLDPGFNVPCKHGNLSRTLPMDFSHVSWVSETFPPHGGTRQIKIDQLETGVAALNKSPGTSARYSAILTVRRYK
jgi:hypothetical protein